MEKETIMIDGVRYYADRPRSCRGCYFWKNRKTGCVLKKENCYYLAEAPKRKSPCEGCCYGPCVSFCMDQAAEAAKEAAQREEVTIKFGKGLAEPFTSKEGKEFLRITVPNQDPADKTPWASFVLPAKAVHENQYGKGL